MSDLSYIISEIPATTVAVTNAYLFEVQAGVSGQSEQCTALVLAAYFLTKLSSGVGISYNNETGEISSVASLQNAYDNGNEILLTNDTPLIISDESSESKVSFDKNSSAPYFGKIESTTKGTINAPIMTSAQFNAILSKTNGIKGYANDLKRDVIFDGSVVQQVAYLSDLDAVADFSSYGEMYFISNTTPTTVASMGVPVKVNATYVSGDLLNFTQSGGTFTYTGPSTQKFILIPSLTATYDGSSNNTTFMIFKNGSVITKTQKTILLGGVTPAPIAALPSALVSLSTGDTLEIWGQNEDSTDDFIVQDLNFIAISMGFSTDSITIIGENYLTKSGQQITADPIDVSGSNITGILKTASLPGLTGDLSSVDGSNDVSLIDHSVVYSKIQEIPTKTLLGNPAVSTGEVSPITIGSGLALSDDGVLSVESSEEASSGAFPWTLDTGNTSGASSINFIFGSYIKVGDYVHATIKFDFTATSLVPVIAFTAPFVSPATFTSYLQSALSVAVSPQGSTATAAPADSGNLNATDTLYVGLKVSSTTPPNAVYTVQVSISYKFQNF